MSEVFTALTPLKVLVVSGQDLKWDDERPQYITAITRAFQGGIKTSTDGNEAYYASGEELGVDVRQFVGSVFWDHKNAHNKNPQHPPNVKKILETCGHLLIIALSQGATAADSGLGKWLNETALIALSDEYTGRIGILPVALDTDAEKTSLREFDEFQRLSIAELGEPALRAGYLGLMAIQNAWVLVGAGADQPIRLFVSHAKRDGAPIALALKAQIESLRFLQRFYDAHDILPGERWRQVLQDGVRKSVVVVLRTDIYEERPWCVQELEWAEKFGCPAVVVDLRNSLAMPRESLPVSGMATVKLQDGNLVRILNGAMREALRVRLFRRSIQLLEQSGALIPGRSIALSRASMSALSVACQEKVGQVIEAVVVAEAFPETYRHAAEKLVWAYFGEKCVLGTLRDFAARGRMEQ